MLDTAELIVVGSGPAGLSAAIESAKRGIEVILIDENTIPGGQLSKQTHKFFGSKEYYAGVRGFEIGNKLILEAKKNNVEIWLDSVVYGVFKQNLLGVKKNNRSKLLKPEKIVFATGASENAINFPGWTLPGVTLAGAVQTFVNLHRVLPGKKFLMIGSGNVGLIVSYQLLQAGAEVIAVLEAAPRIGGYAVHASKVRRAGIPILTSHTIKEAHGKAEVEAATVIALDEKGKPIPGTEKTFEVDTICLAVGLNPSIELPLMAGCKTMYLPELGGRVPIHDENMETTVPGIYVVGDVTGIEEENTAMEEGRLAGVAIAEELGHLKKDKADKLKVEIRKKLLALRMGPFGEARYRAKEHLIQRARCLKLKEK